MRKLFALSGALLVGACASVPMATPDDDAIGKRFEAPAPGEAALYFVRPSGFGMAVLIPVSVGQRQVGTLPSHDWFRVDLPAGHHEVRCTTPEASASMDITLQPGEVRFIETGARLGVFANRCAIEEIDAARGRDAVLAGHRAQEIR